MSIQSNLDQQAIDMLPSIKKAEICKHWGILIHKQVEFYLSDVEIGEHESGEDLCITCTINVLNEKGQVAKKLNLFEWINDREGKFFLETTDSNIQINQLEELNEIFTDKNKDNEYSVLFGDIQDAIQSEIDIINEEKEI